MVLCFFYVQEHPKASGFRRDHGLKSHPLDWEKPGIEPVTPGLNY